MTVYVKSLEGAIPVNFKTKIDYCPPDCGGEDEDTYKYVPCCPKCDKNLETHRYNFCPDCGQKLYWNVEFPHFTK